MPRNNCKAQRHYICILDDRGKGGCTIMNGVRDLVLALDDASAYKFCSQHDAGLSAYCRHDQTPFWYPGHSAEQEDCGFHGAQEQPGARKEEVPFRQWHCKV